MALDAEDLAKAKANLLPALQVYNPDMAIDNISITSTPPAGSRYTGQPDWMAPDVLHISTADGSKIKEISKFVQYLAEITRQTTTYSDDFCLQFTGTLQDLAKIDPVALKAEMDPERSLKAVLQRINNPRGHFNVER